MCLSVTHIAAWHQTKYEIACAQLCGLGHYRMRGFVTVQTAEEFQTWLEEEIKVQGAAEADPFR